MSARNSIFERVNMSTRNVFYEMKVWLNAQWVNVDAEINKYSSLLENLNSRRGEDRLIAVD